MRAVRILLVMLAGSHLFGCVLVDWIPIRFETFPHDDAGAESVVQEKTAQALSKPSKENIRKSHPQQTVKKEIKSPVKPGKVSRREAESPSDREKEIN